MTFDITIAGSVNGDRLEFDCRSESELAWTLKATADAITKHGWTIARLMIRKQARMQAEAAAHGAKQ